MNFYKLTLITLFSLVIGFSFSSCDKDREYNKSGALEADFDLLLNGNGYSQTLTRRISIDEIQNYQRSKEDLLGVELLDAFFELDNLRKYDHIDRINIAVNGVGVYSYTIPINVRYDGEIIIIGDASYRDFMYNVIDLLLHDGFVDVKIELYSKIYDGGPIYFGLRNNLNLRVRD